MDKNTLSNYGWIVICTLVLAVMLALATPFGEFIAGAFKATYAGFGNVTDNALAVIGIGNGGNGGSGEQGGETPDEPQENPNAIPVGGTYTMADGTVLVGDGSTIEWPAEVSDGDAYVYGNYEYRYNMYFYTDAWDVDTAQDGWGVRCINNVANPGAILETINNKPITSLSYTFYECDNLEIAPALPETTIDMVSAFEGCTSLKSASKIPTAMTNMGTAFMNCTSLVNGPDLSGCTQITNMYATFQNCKSLTGTLTIDVNLRSSGMYRLCFAGVDFQAQGLTLTGSSTTLAALGATGSNYQG